MSTTTANLLSLVTIVCFILALRFLSSPKHARLGYWAVAAGMAFAIEQGKGLEDACRLGAACGAANALNSPPGHLKSEDVAALLGRVIVTKME